MQTFDVIILGAGAAGLMCAIRAGQRGKSVLVLDHADQAGSKILVSGGGRCNFTNRHAEPNCYLSQNPPFVISALTAFSSYDFCALVEKHKIAYHEKTLGQLFCNASAKEIGAMLLTECRAASVTIRLKQHIVRVEKTDAFHVQTQDATFAARALVLATGGLSIPKLGATNLSHEIARQFGLAVTHMRPALVPLLLSKEDALRFAELSGLSLEVAASCGKKTFRENMIFTHRGLSGPAILQISSYWKEGLPIALDLLPDTDAEGFLLAYKKLRPKVLLKNVLSERLPQRLAQKLTQAYFASAPIGDISNNELKHIAAMLKKWEIYPTGTEGYAKAEATLGGIDTRELSSKTMESRKVPNLFVVGEALDVTGWLGGYNLQWAWSSGWAAGSAIP